MTPDEALSRLESTYHSPLLGIVRAEVERLRAERDEARLLFNKEYNEANESRRRLKADLAAARALNEAMIATLPGPYYMDHPDGGDVMPEEQMRRMAKDADRYRYLRDNSDGFEITVREIDEDGHETWFAGYPPAELDIAIDVALSCAAKEDGND